MHPELFSIGPWVIHTYGVLVATGIFVSILWMSRFAKENNFPSPERVFDLVFVIVISGFIGARIFYVAKEWNDYQGHPLEIFEIWEGGLVYYGGVLGAIVGHFLYVRFVRLPFLATLDFVIPFIALTHGFGRIGCFFAGCCFGKDGHPVQLYEAFFNFILFGFLIRRYPRRHFPGEIFALYLLLYSTGRFFLEFLRADQAAWFLFYTLQQVLSVIWILFGLAMYGICRSRH